MTTLRQIAANRRNAERSTGPRTEGGKQRSRRNAMRHGLCAETVVETLEDVDDYKAFEIAIASEYDARSVVERELVLRLASLLWRIRRATAIETSLLRIQAENLRDESIGSLESWDPRRHVTYPGLEGAGLGQSWAGADDHRDDREDLTRPVGERERLSSSSFEGAMRDLANCFKALADLDIGVFDRLRRYETSLCRQVVQTLFALQSARRRISPVLRSRWCDKE